jgi:hypothetical protein
LSLALLGIFFAWRSDYNHDEVEHLHATWLMSIGLRPYSDFLEQHHPTLWIVFQPLVAHLRSPRLLIFVVRLYDLLLLGALLWTLHRLVRRLFPDAAPWAVLLVIGSYIFTHNMLLYRPDPTMNTLFYAGLLNWAAFLDERKLARAAAAGLLFGLAIAVLQKALVPVGLVGLSAVALMYVDRRAERSEARCLRRGGAEPDARVDCDRRSLLAGGAAALGAALLPLAGLGAWVLARGIGRDFWFWNYEFNRFFYTRANLSMHFSITDKLIRSIVEDVALWGLGLYGVWRWLRRPRRWDAGDQIRFTLAVTLFGYLLLLCFNRFPFEQYFIVFLPLWVPFAAEAGSSMGVRVAAVAMVAITLGQFIDLDDNQAQRRVQDFLLAHTTSEQTIYAAPPYHPIFRRDGSYFWYNGDLIGEASAAYERLRPGTFDQRLLSDEPWRLEPPAFVFLDPRFPSGWPFRWSQRRAAYHPAGVPDLFAR